MSERRRTRSPPLDQEQEWLGMESAIISNGDPVDSCNAGGDAGVPEELQEENMKKLNQKKKVARRLRNPFLCILLCAFLVIAGHWHRKNCHLPVDPHLIEYYIHGRGNGHWIGSLVTIEALQKKGYNVRIFAGRDMPLPPAYEDTNALLDILEGRTPKQEPIVPSKDLNYTRIQRLGNDLGFGAQVHTLKERVLRNPALSRPLMIISDADLPGVVQGWWNKIPSLHITHGQVFVDTPPPEWLTPLQKKAWKWEGKKNGINSYFADYSIGFNHVPMEGTVRVNVRDEIHDMTIRRHDRLHLYTQQNEVAPPKKNPIVTTYFRDSNGGIVIQAFINAGFDVVVFGGGEKGLDIPKDAPGRIIAVSDAAYFVSFMGVSDGVVASAGCQLVAECVHAQIPMLALYKEADTEHELNVLMAQRLQYKNGNRLLFGTTFEQLVTSKLPEEVQLFMGKVTASKASTSFYNFAKNKSNHSHSSDLEYSNELEDGTPDHLSKVFDVLNQVKAKNEQCKYY